MKKCLTALSVLLAASTAGAQEIGIVDVHAHFQPSPRRVFERALDAAIAFMDRMGIAQSLLMPPPFGPAMSSDAVYDVEDLAFAAKARPDRFAVLGGSSLNVMLHSTPADQVDAGVREKFRQRSREILSRGAVGFGEIAALHLSLPNMGPRHPYENVSPDHPLLLQLADIAAEADVPIDLHCDLVPRLMPLPGPLRQNTANPAELQANLEALRRLLAHNPKARIVWSHVGFEPLMTREPQLVRELLSAHPNLYMSFRLLRGMPRPAAALNPAGHLKPEWLALIEAFPDRFMLGADSFYDDAGASRGSGEEGVRNLRGLLAQLPADLAQRLARGNAARVFRLPQ